MSIPGLIAATAAAVGGKAVIDSINNGAYNVFDQNRRYINYLDKGGPVPSGLRENQYRSIYARATGTPDIGSGLSRNFYYRQVAKYYGSGGSAVPSGPSGGTSVPSSGSNGYSGSGNWSSNFGK